MTRQRISEIPDGDYTAEGWLDDDGRNRDQRLKVKVTVRVRGDEVELSFVGKGGIRHRVRLSDRRVARVDGVGVERLVGAEQGVEELVG